MTSLARVSGFSSRSNSNDAAFAPLSNIATVEKRRKSYRITVAAGIDLNCKQIRHRMLWTPDEKLTPRQVGKELNRQVVRFEEQVKIGSSALGGNVCFVDFAERYMKDYGRLSLKPTSLSNYERNLVRINQAIGHIRLNDLTLLHIQAFYRNLQEEGVRSIPPPRPPRPWPSGSVCGTYPSPLLPEPPVSPIRP